MILTYIMNLANSIEPEQLLENALYMIHAETNYGNRYINSALNIPHSSNNSASTLSLTSRVVLKAWPANSPLQLQAPWPMFGRNQYHFAQSPFKGNLSNIYWRFKIGEKGMHQPVIILTVRFHSFSVFK